MAKLGVITDGISREFEHALSVMNEFDLRYAELQFLWDKEVGDLDDQQMNRVQQLLKALWRRGLLHFAAYLRRYACRRNK